MLNDLIKKFTALQDEIKRIWDEAGADVNFDNVKAISGTTIEKLAAIEKMQADANDQWDVIEKMQKAQKSHEDLDGKTRAPAPGEKMVHADPGAAPERKSFSQLLIGDEYKSWVAARSEGGPNSKSTLDYSIPNFGIRELKTLFQTSAGWAPESIRIPFVAEAVTQPPMVIDIVPSGVTGQAAVVYMRETTRTHASAEKAEGAAFAESTFVLTQDTQTVRKITDSVPVTDEQLEDVAQAESYLGERLRFGLRQRLSSQIINGDAIAPNMEGILTMGGIQTQAKGADPTPDAIYKAMTLVRVTGRAEPTHVVLHPNDWEAIRLLRTADGVYIWGNPSEAGPERIWGKPVIQSTEETQNTGLVGAFSPQYIMLFDRRGVDVQVGYRGNQFTEGEKTIRADLRAALVGFREAAFCTVTGI